ncbi:alpha/beta hydrolase [Mesoplasma chauliocola]|uniref:Alpha/beta hydrolase n=1 Tax=Mesoplasma chauliocola TaxID=216427 RepID=A0A249SNL9_9MOLU|nr:alpha/beta hydrolase [Mesoplasma chauliocola]ASZ09248.1 alpha/beta hydrolase [Mesoplasma chauliocola]
MRKFQLQMIDGKELINFEWKSTKKPVAVIQIIPSFDEHMSMYNNFAKLMCEKSILVVGTDLRSLGESRIDSETQNIYFDKKQGWNKMVEDVKNINTWIKRYHPDLPIFMLGQGLGGNLARAFAIKYSEEIAGMILINTRDYNYHISNLFLKYMNINQILFNPKADAKMLNKIRNKRFNKRHNEMLKIENQWLSNDIKYVEEFNNDPLCYLNFSFSAFKDIAYGNRFITKPQNNEFISKELPLLIQSGGLDNYTKLGKDSQKLFYRFTKLGIDTDFKIYQNLKNKLLHEIVNEPVINDILTFIDKFKENY